MKKRGYGRFLLQIMVIALFCGCAFFERDLLTPDWEKEGIVVFEDFESGMYEKWQVTGTAFGVAPHTGTSPGQQPVTGFLGKGLVNSYFPNDKARGKLRSQPFSIQKPFIAFLIGGGRHPGETFINLVVDGEVVRSETGNNSEMLQLAVWDVSEYMGKTAFFEIVDDNTGAWGHINIDQIVFADNKPRKELFLTYKPMLKAGEFEKIYDPGVGEKERWYINDHCFIYGPDGLWHLFGITHEEPAKPLDEKNFAHAVSPGLTEPGWKKLPFALTAQFEPWREVHLWAPHVVFHDGLYYMFYCAGDTDHITYKIHLAVSKDLYHWTRHPENPVVVDGFDARDPFVFKHGDTFIMYYTATEPATGGYHIVAYRKSDDLIHWSERNICFIDPSRGTYGGPTESPFVVRRGEYYYLFIGPRGGYVGTDVFRSDTAFFFDNSDKVGHIDSHALEVIHDLDGKWYVSSCGWGRGGVYLAPLTWLDGLNDKDTSLPPPEPAEQ